jgi:hypothetical protein
MGTLVSWIGANTLTAKSVDYFKPEYVKQFVIVNNF